MKNIYTINKLNMIKNNIKSIKFYYDTLKTSSLQKKYIMKQIFLKY